MEKEGSVNVNTKGATGSTNKSEEPVVVDINTNRPEFCIAGDLNQN